MLMSWIIFCRKTHAFGNIAATIGLIHSLFNFPARLSDILLMFLSPYSSFYDYLIYFNHESQAFLSLSYAYKCVICLFYSRRFRFHAKQIFCFLIDHRYATQAKSFCRTAVSPVKCSHQVKLIDDNRADIFESFTNTKRRRRKGFNLLLASTHAARTKKKRKREREREKNFISDVCRHQFFSSSLSFFRLTSKRQHRRFLIEPFSLVIRHPTQFTGSDRISH